VSPRIKLLVVFLACAAPLVLAWAAWQFGWGTGSPGNYGELIAPRPVSGAPFAELRGKWVLVSFDRASCDAYCERKLYYMRQVRRAQGKEQSRVERVWVVLDGGESSQAALPTAFESTRLASSVDATVFPGNRVDHIYLIDPLGNLMLRFPRDPDPSRMVKDLQRLLKYSRIG
jgi:cytochrome oxidase Cu insertion factor (SCO1/SenC/PrrC family)